MTEKQADKIIKLLGDINNKLPEKTTYNIDNIASKITFVEKAINNVETAVKELQEKVDNLVD